MFLEEKARKAINKINKKELEQAFIKTYQQITEKVEKSLEECRGFEEEKMTKLVEITKREYNCYVSVLKIFERNLFEIKNK